MLSDGRRASDYTVSSLIGPALASVLEQFNREKYVYQSRFSRITLPGDLYDVDDPERGINEGVLSLSE